MRVPKQVGSRSFKAIHKTMTHHVLNKFIHDAMQEDAFAHTHLGCPSKQLSADRWRARWLRTPNGTLTRGDMVTWNEAGTRIVATAVNFIQHGSSYFGQVARHVHMGDCRWRPAALVEDELVPAERLQAVTYLSIDGIFYIRFEL